MSSIFGIINGNNQPVAKEKLLQMQTALNHWNADAVHIWNDTNVGLGHLMLYNTPESLQEKLPLFDHTSALSITADARIDNREEILTLLGINNTAYKTLPDSTLILLLYKKYEEHCVEHMIGDFAFAVWDKNKQRLFCARDQMGIKPFFYYQKGDFFAFASEKKGLLCLPEVDQKIDKDFFYNQAFWPPVQAADTTLYHYIKRLEPAHSLMYNPRKNTINIKTYWSFDIETEIRLSKKTDYYDGLRYHLEKSVLRRVRSQYNIGTELSGGLDSSVITSIANKCLKERAQTLTVFSNTQDEHTADSLVGPEMNERVYLDAAIEFNSLKENSELIKDDIWTNPLEEIDFQLQVNDGLEMLYMLWQVPIKQAAMNKGVRTLLSGFMGDEMVTYRGQYHFLQFIDEKKYYKYFKAKCERPFRKTTPFLNLPAEYLLHKINNIVKFHSKSEHRPPFPAIPLKYRYNQNDVLFNNVFYKNRFKSYRHFQVYRLMKPDVALRAEAETRLGMAFKVEPRYPMADIELTQFYLSMPNNLKNDGNISRYTYRAAFKDYLPEIILNREGKQGNIAPFKSSRKILAERGEIINNILSNMTLSVRSIDTSEYSNSFKQIRILEILRWHQKNFEKLEKNLPL